MHICKARSQGSVAMIRVIMMLSGDWHRPYHWEGTTTCIQPFELRKQNYLMMLFWIALWTGDHHVNLHVPCFFSCVFPTHKAWSALMLHPGPSPPADISPVHGYYNPWIFLRFSEDLPYHSACIFWLARKKTAHRESIQAVSDVSVV